VKILVTGGAGFIASHVVDQYVADGHEVVVVDNLSSGKLANLNPAARFYEVDILDDQLEEIIASERPEVINHHAAQIDVRVSVADPLLDAEINIMGSLRIIELARKYETRRIIYISSGGAVYGEPVYLPCDEDHPVNPICQYGASKHTVEHYLYMYHENYELEYIVLRYANIYGPRQDPDGEAGVVAIFTGQMLASEPVRINGDGTQERDFIHVSDAARANALALGDVPSGLYNIGSAQGTSVNQIFEVLKELTRYPEDALYGPAKVGETYRIFLSAEKAYKDLGWKQTIDLRTGMSDTVEFFRREGQEV